MEEPFWCLPRNYKRYKDIVKTYDGYCYDCQKPMKRYFNIRCTNCNWKLIWNGNPNNIVTFGQVGKSVINYQHYLHRSMFNKAHIQIEYRGLKEDRVKYKLSPETLLVTTNKLDKYIISLNNEFSELYLDCKKLNNYMPNRILYNIILYYTSYYVENSSIWESEAQFMASVISNIHNTIYRRYMQLYKKKGLDYSINYKRKSYGVRYHYKMFEFIDLFMGGVMSDVNKLNFGSEIV